MYKDLLPIGSVILLKGGEKRLMICGRVITQDNTNKISDYVGCYYPEGIIDSSKLFFFDHELIQEIFFIGCQDKEEINFRSNVLAKLDYGELMIEDGKIVIKNAVKGTQSE